MWVNTSRRHEVHCVRIFLQKYSSILGEPHRWLKKPVVEVVGQITPAEPYKNSLPTYFWRATERSHSLTRSVM